MEEEIQTAPQSDPAETRRWRRFGEVTLYDTDDECQVYANICGVSFGVDDVLMHFALKDREEAVAYGVAKVYMTASHAKRLYSALGRLIERHEQRFGPIRDFVEEESGPGRGTDPHESPEA